MCSCEFNDIDDDDDDDDNNNNNNNVLKIKIMIIAQKNSKNNKQGIVCICKQCTDSANSADSFY